MNPNGELETIAQAAARWGVSTMTIRRAIQRGKLTAYQIAPGGTIRLDTHQVDAAFGRKP